MTSGALPAASADVRRRVASRLGLLAAVLIVAGALPWVTVGPLGARLFALPLLVVGVLVGVTALRIRSVATATPAQPRQAAGGCANCACGGCGSTA